MSHNPIQLEVREIGMSDKIELAEIRFGEIFKSVMGYIFLALIAIGLLIAIIGLASDEGLAATILGLAIVVAFGSMLSLVYRGNPKRLWIEDGRLYSDRDTLAHGPEVSECEIAQINGFELPSNHTGGVRFRYPKPGYDRIDNSSGRARRASSSVFLVSALFVVGGRDALTEAIFKLVEAGLKTKGHLKRFE